MIAVGAGLLLGAIRGRARRDHFEATSRRSGGGKAHVGADLAGETFADGKAHPESLAAVALAIVHLIKLVEQMRWLYG